MTTSVKPSQEITNAKSHNPHTATPPAGTGTSTSAVMEENSEIGTKALNHSKKVLHICTWNTLTLLPPEAPDLLDKSLSNHQIDVACIQKKRIPGESKGETKGYQILTSGYQENKGIHGVGIAISKRIKSSVKLWKAVCAKVCMLRLEAKPTPVTIISCYAPTEEADSATKDDFYQSLQATVDDTPKGDLLRIGGDMNTKLGQAHIAESTYIARAVKPSQRNDNGDRLALFSASNGLCMANSMFRKKIHQLPTWCSRDRKTRNQIDFLLIRRRWRASISDTRVRKDGLLLDCDHRMLTCALNSKLRVYRKTQKTQRLNLEALRQPTTARKCCEELRRTAEGVQRDATVKQKWEPIKKAIVNTAAKTLGTIKYKQKERITQETANAIQTREKLKNKGANQKKVTDQRKRVKQLIRRDKSKYLDEKTAEIEIANEKEHTRQMYRLINTLGGSVDKKTITESLKDANGNMITDIKRKMERWKEHYEQLLSTETTPSLPQAFNQVDLEAPTKREIRDAIEELWIHRAGRCDGIPPELYKVGRETLVDLIELLLDSIWSTDKIPDEWRVSILLPFHKKGDPQVCANFRGISLLCIGFKVLESILLTRLTEAYEPHARDNQVGFKKKRGCCDQVFTLRNEYSR